MSNGQQTADQAKQHYIEIMGDDLGTIYHRLWQEIAWVHMKWGDFITLFGTSESRIELMNDAAPAFCRLIQDSLWENVLLHIARLTDRGSTGGKQNLTIQRLPALITNSAKIQLSLKAAVDNAIDVCTFARDWRNRHIAHSDLLLHISDDAEPLEFASRKRVSEALEALADVLHVLSQHYLNSTTFFQSEGIDALHFLYVLDDGVKAAQSRRERMRNGKAAPSEMKPRSI